MNKLIKPKASKLSVFYAGAMAVAVEFVGSSYLDNSVTPFYLHSVMCSGSEDSISQCSFINASEQVCQSNLPASVICQGEYSDAAKDSML